MTVNFPSSPNVGDQVTGPGGEVWEFDGVKWVAAGGSDHDHSHDDGEY